MLTPPPPVHCAVPLKFHDNHGFDFEWDPVFISRWLHEHTPTQRRFIKKDGGGCRGPGGHTDGLPPVLFSS